MGTVNVTLQEYARGITLGATTGAALGAASGAATGAMGYWTVRNGPTEGAMWGGAMGTALGAYAGVRAAVNIAKIEDRSWVVEGESTESMSP